MRIKLAILERDESYLNRIVTVFSTKFSDNFELYSFTNQETAMATLNPAKIDVLLADDSFEIDPKQLPKRCALAYFVESADIETLRDQQAIFKYQRVELIYKQILSLYAEKASSVSGLRMNDDDCKVIAFCSAAGGVGSSSLAAACAISLAARGHRTMYLNLEKFGGASMFFTGEGQFDMSDVVFSVKSKKSNLALKLESYARRDENGVYFFASSKLALDMIELTAEEIVRLVSELQVTGSYEYVVLDCDFSLDRSRLSTYRRAHSLVFVSDGSQTANVKTARAVEALTIIEQNEDAPLTNRLKLLYNKFSNKTGRSLEDLGIPELGGAPRFEHASAREVVRQLAGMRLFDQIL